MQGIKAAYHNRPSSSAQLEGELHAASLSPHFNSQDKKKDWEDSVSLVLQNGVPGALLQFGS